MATRTSPAPRPLTSGGAPKPVEAISGPVADRLADRAYRALEELIITSQLAPQTFVSESQLCKMIGIGRTPVREALKRLQNDGLVAVLPRKGIFITDVDVRQQLLLLEVRREVERLIARRAARYRSNAERERFIALANEIEAAAANEDEVEFMRLDRQLNELMAAASRNPVAAQFIEPLWSLSRRFWYSYRTMFEHSMRIGAETHAELARAIADGDEERAAKASDRCLDYSDVFTRSTLGIDPKQSA